MKNIVKIFIFMLLTIANINLVSAMEKTSPEASGTKVVEVGAKADLRDISDADRDEHVKQMYDFARKHTALVHRRAKTAALFGKFTADYKAPRPKPVVTRVDTAACKD